MPSSSPVVDAGGRSGSRLGLWRYQRVAARSGLVWVQWTTQALIRPGEDRYDPYGCVTRSYSDIALRRPERTRIPPRPSSSANNSAPYGCSEAWRNPRKLSVHTAGRKALDVSLFPSHTIALRRGKHEKAEEKARGADRRMGSVGSLVRLGTRGQKARTADGEDRKSCDGSTGRVTLGLCAASSW